MQQRARLWSKSVGKTRVHRVSRFSSSLCKDLMRPSNRCSNPHSLVPSSSPETVSSEMENPTKTPLHPDVPPGTTLKYSTTLHPVQKIERDHATIEKLTKRKLQAAAYGSALPMRKMMQEHMLAQCQRLPGLPSSYAGLDSLTGRDEKIDFEDFMNLPHESAETPTMDPRDELEKILGIRARSQKHE